MKNMKGFTLIEVSIVLLIIGLALGGLLMPLGTRMDESKRLETRNKLEEIKQAMISFATASPNGRLPCPDTNNDGLEDAPLGVCLSTAGQPPYATISVSVSLNAQGQPVDAWGRPLIYHVDGTFADGPPLSAATYQGTTGCTTNLTPNISIGICSLTGAYDIFLDGALTNQIAVSVPAVLISTGKVTGPLSLPEQINNNPASTSFVKAIYGGPESSVPFNDTVVWISGNEIVGKLVDAGVLP